MFNYNYYQEQCCSIAVWSVPVGLVFLCPVDLNTVIHFLVCVAGQICLRYKDLEAVDYSEKWTHYLRAADQLSCSPWMIDFVMVILGAFNEFFCITLFVFVTDGGIWHFLGCSVPQEVKVSPFQSHYYYHFKGVWLNYSTEASCSWCTQPSDKIWLKIAQENKNILH